MTSLTATVKRLIKRGLQNIAARYGRHVRTPRQPELLLLMYHRILPADDPRTKQEEPGMLVTPETFRQHMSIISSMFQTVHLSEWLRLKNDGEELPLRSCAITFDDGWADNYEFAYPVLQELKIPATIFLVSDMIATNMKFWPERLSQILTIIAQQHPDKWTDPCVDWIMQSHHSYTYSSTAPTQEQLSEIIADAKMLSDEEIQHRLDSIEERLKLHNNFATSSLLDWQQVNQMCSTGLIEVGSHTCQHIRLTADREVSQLEHEILTSKKNIEKHTGQTVKTFCYPNGDFSDEALNMVRHHYAGAVTTQSGWNTVNTDNHLLQRVGLHEDISNDRTSFLARLSDWL